MRKRALMPLLFVGLMACDNLDPASWKSPEDCREISDVAWRDECFSRVAVPVFRQDRAAGEALLKEVSDPLVKDYIYLAVTREVDPGSPEYCRKIESKEFKTRCDMLVRRPHLHRELVGAPPEQKGPPLGGLPTNTPATNSPPVQESPPR